MRSPDLEKIRARNRPGHNPWLNRLDAHPDTLVPLGADRWRGRWEECFGRAAPLWVDLGCGSGNWLIAMAGRHPDFNFLGVEIRFKRLVRAAEKTERLGLRNLRFIRHSIESTPDLFAPGSVAALVIQFPEPWLKRKQRKNRIFKEAFIGNLSGLLEPGGRLLVKTDQQDYFDQMRAGLLEAGLIIQAETRDLHCSPLNEDNIQTEFEAMYRKEGAPIAWLDARKAVPSQTGNNPD